MLLKRAFFIDLKKMLTIKYVLDRLKSLTAKVGVEI